MKKLNSRPTTDPGLIARTEGTKFTKLFAAGYKKPSVPKQTIPSFRDTSYQLSQSQGLLPVLQNKSSLGSTTFLDVARRGISQQPTNIVSAHQLSTSSGDKMPTVSNSDVGNIELQKRQNQELPARILSYRTQIETNGKALVKFLDISSISEPWDCRWSDSSSSATCVDLNASFLKSLQVNPNVFTEANGSVPFEWSHVILLALYDGPYIPGNTSKKGIWHSVHNNTAFAVARPSVRGCTTTCIDLLQLRASKSMIIDGFQNAQTNIIIPVQKLQHVHFSVKKERATMSKFLYMPEKVHSVLVPKTLKAFILK
jgi:hypothetical protein